MCSCCCSSSLMDRSGSFFICLYCFAVNSPLYFVYYIVYIAYYLLICKSQFMEATAFKIISPKLISSDLLFSKVIFTVYFYNKIACQTGEINNVVTNNMLSSKPVRARPRLEAVP